ncbi:hypothetical protein [Clostridium ihumii]|uniref:hypothetical protein n=1 Tax=Clostridium ihumii TaxID=1470356 RepID=UPI000590CE56|nr:hypothetical protein [Clostridium ihumii]
MSWLKEVKLLYSSTLIVIFFTIINCFSSVVSKTVLSYNLISICILMMVIISFLLEKANNKGVIFIGLIITSLLIYFLDYEIMFIPSIIFSNFCILFNLYKLGEYRCYIECKNILGILGFASLLLTTMFSYLTGNGVLAYNMRAYVLYFALFIINLRETMRYDNSIFNKRAKYYNISMIILAIMLTMNNFMINVIKGVIKLISKLLNIIAQASISLLKVPLEGILKFLSTHNNLTEIKSKSKLETTKVKSTTNNLSINYEILEPIIKIIITIILLYCIYISIKKIVEQFIVKDDEKTYEEYSEKLYNTMSKEKISKKYIKNIFRNKFNVKEEILYNYMKFENDTKKIGIFKSYMTPTQLKNIYEIKVSEETKIDKFTEIYNEAKFSNHEINNENLYDFKKNYKDIKMRIVKKKLQKGG